MSEEKQLKIILEKMDQIDTSSTEELRRQVREKLQELRDKKLFPKGYAKTINEKLGIKDRNTVYQSISGKSGHLNLDIAEALVDLALEKKREQKIIEKADQVLDKE